jgi:NTP pyrophosphatase (non-canonical NTP hydrolase)
MEELIVKIERWAEDRNIISGSTTIAQAEKTIEECEELIYAIGEDDLDEIKDAIGDIVVTLVIQAKMNGVDFLDCVAGAYETIKDRKGKMVDGKFVKEA